MTEAAGFHFILPVWGNDYVDMFRRAGLPSQLAPGNLPSVPALDASVYHIFTTAEDRRALEDFPAFRRLKQLVRVQFDDICAEGRSAHDAMSEAYRLGLAYAQAHNAVAIMLTPDLVFADGTFANMISAWRAGSPVVLIHSLRAERGKAESELCDRTEPFPESLSLSPRALVDIALRNLHPRMQSHVWQGEGALHPAHLLWPVEKEGLVVHAFHLHPLLLVPREGSQFFGGTLDEDLPILVAPDPATIHVVIDSDEMFAMELCQSSGPQRLSAHKQSVTDAVAWALAETEPWHWSIAQRSIRIHCSSNKSDKWQAAELSGALTIERLRSRLDKSPPIQWVRFPIAMLRRAVRRARWAVAYEKGGFSPPAYTGLPRFNSLDRFLYNIHPIYRTFILRGLECRRRKLDDLREGKYWPWNGGWLFRQLAIAGSDCPSAILRLDDASFVRRLARSSGMVIVDAPSLSLQKIEIARSMLPDGWYVSYACRPDFGLGRLYFRAQELTRTRDRVHRPALIEVLGFPFRWFLAAAMYAIASLFALISRRPEQGSFLFIKRESEPNTAEI